jgi:hypothetical protein
MSLVCTLYQLCTVARSAWYVNCLVLHYGFYPIDLGIRIQFCFLCKSHGLFFDSARPDTDVTRNLVVVQTLSVVLQFSPD